jgi:hypothetical protein
MLQRAFYLLHDQLDLDQLFRLTEQPLVDQLVAAAGQSPAADLLDGLFGPARKLYKRLGELSHFQSRELYEQLARQPYAWLVGAGEALASVASTHVGRRVAPHEVLIDAPPVRREVEFHVEVFFPKEGIYRPLAEISPAVVTLATRQFDDYVKRVRILAHPRLAAELRAVPLDRLLHETLKPMK